MGLFEKLLNMNNSSKIDPWCLPGIDRILTANEHIELAFRSGRGLYTGKDVYLFTNLRIIYVNFKGNAACNSIPYKSISRFSATIEGGIDKYAMLRVWLKGFPIPAINAEFKKNTDIFGLQQLLAYYVLGQDKYEDEDITQQQM